MTHAKSTVTKRSDFLKLLREDILKLNLADLDFGIYRILNYRRGAVETFLNETLPTRIETVLNEQAGERQSALQREVGELREQLETIAKGVGLSSAFSGDVLNDALKAFPIGQEYLKKAEALVKAEAEARFSDSEEERLYNTLYTFFSRYYEDGDFLPQPRRGKEARFSVDYQGEDVHFSWRGRGSHYVKSSEQLRSYAFKIDGTDIRFQFVSADLARDNTKGDKRYLVPLHTPEITDSSVTISFEFRPLSADEAKLYPRPNEVQEKLIDDALELLYPKLQEKVNRLERSALERHLRRYARKNLTDYFVHPNLGAFLRGEFDYYLKNEYLDVSSFTSPEALTDRFIKFRALQEVGYDIISFLDQIESFQARLFEKRRFVLQTDYLIPARLLSDELKAQAAENEAQVQAWRELFALSGEVDKETLEHHPTLVINTQHFNPAFKQQVLALFDDLDDVTDGVLVHSENYGALRTLEPKYGGKVKVIYIDPPYNTGGDGFLYKDDFSKHSTWLTMMEERLKLGRSLLADDGAMLLSIDDYEQTRLKEALDGVFGTENFIANVIWQKVYAPKNSAKYFSDDHEYLPVYTKNREAWNPYLLPRSDEVNARYINPDNDERGVWKPGDLSARNYYSQGQYTVTSPSGKTFEAPSGRYWGISKERFEKLDQDDRIWWGASGDNMPAFKRFLSEVKQGVVPQTLWKYEDVGHTQDAKKELLSIVKFERTEDVLNTVKPLRLLRRILQLGTSSDETAWIIDFFAGSATTGHAVIQQNADDGGKRKFVLVEMGEYFEQITYQRVIKAMYCPTWRDGKPAETTEFPLSGLTPDWVERSPRLVKVLRLESFEDSLNALELPQEQSARAKGLQEIFGKDYLLKYLLPTEVEDTSEVFLSTERLEQPFDYKLRIHTPEGPREQPVDLIETFNLLMGFHVKRMFQLTGDRAYTCVEAQSDEGPVLVLWRDLKDLDPAAERAFLEGALTVSAYAKIYVNGDSALPRAESLDAEFKNRLLARAVGILA